MIWSACWIGTRPGVPTKSIPATRCGLLARVRDGSRPADAVADQHDAPEMETVDDRTDIARQILDRVVGTDGRVGPAVAAQVEPDGAPSRP